MTTTRVVDDVRALGDAAEGWDRLAELQDRPYCLSSWMLAWWENVATHGARLRIVMVEDGDELLGVAPLFVERGPGGLDTYRFLGRDTSMRLVPLVHPERRAEAIGALAAGVGRLDPRVEILTLEGVEPGAEWIDAIAGSFPDGPAWIHRDEVMPAPSVRVDPEGYEAWFAKKSSNFRQQMRRARRQLDAVGAVFRRSSPDDAARDLDTFSRLHLDRWEGRGGSVALRPGVLEMLKQVAATEIESGRMRIFNIDQDGGTISTQIFMCAGREYGYWLGGFDDGHAAQRPGLLAILAGIEDAHEGGFRRVDLGPGDDEYKYRLTDEEEDLVWTTYVARGAGFGARRARLAPHFARVALRERLSDDMKLKINKLLRRA